MLGSIVFEYLTTLKNFKIQSRERMDREHGTKKESVILLTLAIVDTFSAWRH